MGNIKKIIALLVSFSLSFALVVGLSAPFASAAPAKAPTKITLNKASVNLTVGSKVKLKVKTVKPNKASKKVTWKSSNKKVASVASNGLVQAKKAGSAVITAKSKKGKTIAKCKINVKAPARKIEKRKTTGRSLKAGNVQLAKFDSGSAVEISGTRFDTSHVSQGYVGASAKSAVRLKLEVSTGGKSMYYDMPSDGTPIIAPLSLGNGTYTFSIWENTSGQKYARLSTTSVDVNMQDEFQPYLSNNLFCDYDAQSTVVKVASQLAKKASNEGDFLAEVYDWVVANVTYDTAKAKKLSGKSGYVPDPDSTYSTKKGICFDYSALVAAMLRSQGIPCKIVTGNVAPDNIYHAWNMTYIDGTWVSSYIDVKSKTWTRLDTTFAAGGEDNEFIGDGSNYANRYMY